MNGRATDRAPLQGRRLGAWAYGGNSVTGYTARLSHA